MGIGNVLWHEYDQISDIAIWNVVQQYLPALKVAVWEIEASLKEQF